MDKLQVFGLVACGLSLVCGYITTTTDNYNKGVITLTIAIVSGAIATVVGILT